MPPSPSLPVNRPSLHTPDDSSPGHGHVPVLLTLRMTFPPESLPYAVAESAPLRVCPLSTPQTRKPLLVDQSDDIAETPATVDSSTDDSEEDSSDGTDVPVSSRRETPMRQILTMAARSNGPRIPKPSGEVTRLTRGGYSLRKVLGWDQSLYCKVQRFVKKLARKHLVLGRTLLMQSTTALTKVFDVAIERFEFLNLYEDGWVLSDFLRVYLSNAARQKR
ncbi:hypothetical protein JAAARDRAFT_51794 [Jaapia argillacea MUCL 33604]|uniref:Uncharacterized protein n=1 Tax=Jaapia argillacea MUCL 33604 TaxID=933084 RepID=A0A067P339_9AGAM|nr:hypothetical protein JAAARDRAFT_51794 [Jaapia argillacea MUCL 33604]